MKEEQWIQKIKERLDDYSEPLPLGRWERLESDILASKNLMKRKKVIAFRRWSMVAAAVLLVAVFSVGVWLLNNPIKEDLEHANVVALAVMENGKFQHAVPVTGGNITASLTGNKSC